MKVIAIIGDAPNHIALTSRLHKISKISKIVKIEKKRSGTSTAPFHQKVASATVGRSFRNAWHKMQLEYAMNFAIPDVPVATCDSSNSEVTQRIINEERPDLVIVSGTDLLKQPIIETIQKHGKIMNLHTGISPYIKGGPNCTNWALATRRFECIGNSIMWLDAGIDSGNLIATARTPLDGSETASQLHQKVLDHAHRPVLRVLQTSCRRQTAFIN